MRADARRVFPAAALAALLAAGCAASRPAGPIPEPFSRTLGPFVHYEEGLRVVITVGTFATRNRAREPFFPIEIGMANKSRTETLVLSRESFTVQVADGPELAAATPSELLAGYRAIEADRRLFRSREFTATKYDRYNRVASHLYPNSPSRGVVREAIELPTGAFFEDVLYFPNPGYSLEGQAVRLLVRLKANEEPLVVSFKVE